MALSLDGMGVGGGVVLSLAVPSIAAANFAGAGTPAEREAQVQPSYGGMNGRRRLHSDSSHTSHTSDHTTSSGAEGQAGECAGDFSIVSTLWADSAGCYADFGESVYEYVGAEGTYMIAPIPLYNSADSPSVWVAGTVAAGAGVEDAATIDPHCHSEGDTTIHGHPADVELWLCDIDNTGIVYTEVTAEQFSGECGCGETAATTTTAPAPAPTPAAAATPSTPAPVAGSRDLGTPAPVAAVEEEEPTAAPVAPPAPTAAPVAEEETPAPVGAPVGGDDDAGGSASVTTSETPNLLCGEIQPLSVVTSKEVLEEVNGCYEETGHEYHEEGGHFFSITGSHLKGQYAVFPGYVDPLSADPRWFLGFLGVEAEETLIYCISAQPPSFGHPSVANWYCDDGTGEFVLLEDEDFDILCGCESTTSTTTTTSDAEPTTLTAAPSMTPDHGGASHAPGTGAPTHGDDHSHGGPSPAPGAVTPAASAAPASHDHSSGHETTAAPVAADRGIGGTEAPAAEHTGSEHTSTTTSDHDHTATTTSAEMSHDDHTTSDHTTSDHTATEHTTSDHTTSAHTTSAEDGEGHGGGETPSPTTVARGIAGPPDTPAPVAGGEADTSLESTEANAGCRGAFPGAVGSATVGMFCAAAVAVLAGGRVLRGN